MDGKNILLHIFCYSVLTLTWPTVIWTSNTQDKYYGNGWLYFVSDNGTNYLMNYSTLPCDTEDMSFGDAHFYLYTRNNVDKPEMITIPKDNNIFESIYFNKSNDIRLITHGWLSSEKVNWLQNMKLSLLREFDLNVITVDWSELSHNIVYPFAALSTRYVGKKIAKLLNEITKTFRIGYSNIHLIGHSLGAHIMGYAGMFSDNKISRITGLDPARPLFEIPEILPEYRLDKNDAHFVDILHTCGGVYGYLESYGHADFFPNNGRPIQPGCNGVRHITDSCSHGKSHEYFQESIQYKNKTSFISYPCESWKKFNNGECKENSTSMGYHTSVNNIGNFYLDTRNESEYTNKTD